MTLKTFLVDDSRETLTTLRELLTHSGDFEVIGEASSEKDAIEWLLLNEGSWQVAVVDLLLQDGSGFNVLSHCTKYLPGKVVILSGYVTPVIAERCQKLGAVAAFAKSDFDAFMGFILQLGEAHRAGGAGN